MLTGFIFLALLGVVGVQVYRLYGERSTLQAKLEELRGSVHELEADNERIADEVAYYAQPANLMHAVKSWFNYRKPDEKLYLVVPREEGRGKPTP